MRSVTEHQNAVTALFPEPRTEHISVESALGRSLTHDVIAALPLPGFDNSAMDGYAVRADDISSASADTPIRLPVTEDIPAGRTDRLTLTGNSAHRIMTGAPLPAGADTVVQVEKTDAGVEYVAIREPVAVGTAIRRAGSDISTGDVAMRAGQLITPPAIGLLSALGLHTVEVYAPIRVLILSTGSELVSPGQQLRHGQIYESNSPMLAAAVTEAGGIAHTMHFVPDDAAQLRTRLDEAIADSRADLIVTSGGVSAGAYEVVKDALADDAVEFVKVAMQPGMPQGSGHYSSASGQRIPIVTLPGNPVSAQVSFEVFLRDPMRRAMGLPTGRRRLRARLSTDIHSPRGKRQFRRGIVWDADGMWMVEPIGPPSSHHIRYMAAANALIDINIDVEKALTGTDIEVILINEIPEHRGV